nr:MAG TPA: Protein of unknown function (DUF1492) [Caudoviricetes sp.]
MTTKEYLTQIERFDRIIENKLSEMYQLKTMAYSVSGLNSNEKVQTSFEQDKIGNAVSKIIDLENEINTLINNTLDKKMHIINQIDSIKNVNMYHVLSSRYVNRKNFDDIAAEMNYSRMQINRIHGKALQEFEKNFGNEYLDQK